MPLEAKGIRHFSVAHHQVLESRVVPLRRTQPHAICVSLDQAVAGAPAGELDLQALPKLDRPCGWVDLADHLPTRSRHGDVR